MNKHEADMIHTCDSSTWEAEVGGLWAPSQPGLSRNYQTIIAWTIQQVLISKI